MGIEVALSDFGLAIEGAAMTGSRSGTLEYMAPEIGGAKEAPPETRPPEGGPPVLGSGPPHCTD